MTGTTTIRIVQLRPLVETPPGSGRYLPEAWEAEYVADDLPGVTLSLGMELVNGTPTCRTVLLLPRDWDTGVPAADLELPLERILAEVIDAATSPRQPRGELIYSSAAPEERRSRRRNKITDDYLTEVAQVYREADARGDPPTVAVQKAFELARSTAGRHVQLARQRGFLMPVREAAEVDLENELVAVGRKARRAIDASKEKEKRSERS